MESYAIVNKHVHLKIHNGHVIGGLKQMFTSVL